MAPPVSPARTGVWVGIAAITMSFAAYTSALIVRQGAAPDWQHFKLPPILYLNYAGAAGEQRDPGAATPAHRRPVRSPGPARHCSLRTRGWPVVATADARAGASSFIAGQFLAWRGSGRAGSVPRHQPQQLLLLRASPRCTRCTCSAAHAPSGTSLLPPAQLRLLAPDRDVLARPRSTGTSWRCSGSICWWCSRCGCSRPGGDVSDSEMSACGVHGGDGAIAVRHRRPRSW